MYVHNNPNLKVTSFAFKVFLWNPNGKTLGYLLSDKKTLSHGIGGSESTFSMTDGVRNSVCLTQPLTEMRVVLTASLNFGHRTKSGRLKKNGTRKSPKKRLFLCLFPGKQLGTRNITVVTRYTQCISCNACIQNSKRTGIILIKYSQNWAKFFFSKAGPNNLAENRQHSL